MRTSYQYEPSNSLVNLVIIDWVKGCAQNRATVQIWHRVRSQVSRPIVLQVHRQVRDQIRMQLEDADAARKGLVWDRVTGAWAKLGEQSTEQR